MQKRMTERLAWLYLAKLWGKPIHDEINDTVWVEFGGLRHYGLCHCLNTLFKEVPWSVYKKMISKIDAELRRIGAPNYLAEMKVSGAKVRAAFCRKQARLLAKGKRK